MAITKEEIIDAVGSMSVMDLNDLVKAFEEKFGVSAAALNAKTKLSTNSRCFLVERLMQKRRVKTLASPCLKVSSS